MIPITGHVTPNVTRWRWIILWRAKLSLGNAVKGECSYFLQHRLPVIKLLKTLLQRSTVTQLCGALNQSKIIECLTIMFSLKCLARVRSVWASLRIPTLASELTAANYFSTWRSHVCTFILKHLNLISCGIHYNAGSVIIRVTRWKLVPQTVIKKKCCLLLCVLHGGNGQVPTAGHQVVTVLHSHHGKYSNTKGA